MGSHAAKPAEQRVVRASTQPGSLEDYDVVAARLRSRLEAQMAHETSDAAWAAELKNGLARVREQLAHDVPELDDIRVESTNCGQSICRLRVRHRTPDGFATIKQASGGEAVLSGGSHWTRERQSDGSYITILYVTRAGQPLPMN